MSDSEDWACEQFLLREQMKHLKESMRRQGGMQFPALRASAVSDVLWVLKAALGTLDALGYTYHGGELFKPPLGPARAPAAPVPHVCEVRRHWNGGDGFDVGAFVGTRPAYGTKLYAQPQPTDAQCDAIIDAWNPDHTRGSLRAIIREALSAS